MLLPVIQPMPRDRHQRPIRRLRLIGLAAGGVVLLAILATAGATRSEGSSLDRVQEALDRAVQDSRDAVTEAMRAQLLAPRPAVGYRRGKRAVIEVVALGSSRVEIGTALAFLAMRDAAARDGIELRIESGFRDHEQQRALYRKWKRGKGNRAARPGRSNHQSGRALDISVLEPGTLEWLQANAASFGFKRTVASEPWHWEYVEAPRAAKPRPKKKRGKRARRGRR